MTMTMSSVVRPFDVLRVPFEFEDRPGVCKIRPVVVASVQNGSALLLVKVTGHGPRKEFPGEVRLADWEEAGLSKPSTVRCSTSVVVDLGDLESFGHLGHLSEGYSARVVDGLIEAGKIERSSV